MKNAVIEIHNFKGTRAEFLRRYPQLRFHNQQKLDHKEPGRLDGQWICSLDLEDEFSIGETYETREAAIAGAHDELSQLAIGDFFYTGQLSYVRSVPSFPSDGDRLIEDAGDNMGSDWGESPVENWTDKASAVVADLEVNIAKVWDEWVVRHDLEITGYTCEYIEKHQIGEHVDATAVDTVDSDTTSSKEAP